MSTAETIHTKPLDIRTHKKDWLDIASLRKMRQEIRDFCDYTLAHERRLVVEACCICGSQESRRYGVTYGVPYEECLRCSHVYARWALRSEDLAEYYRRSYFAGSVYLDKDQVQSRTKMLLEPKLAFVGRYVKTPTRRWLDVGTGNGGVVACARRMGFDAHGIELGEDAIAFAQEVFGVKLEMRTVYEELDLRGPASYDIVSFFMVLEHVNDPFHQVQCAARLLRPDGLLVIEVPKADSVAAWGDIAYPDQGLRQMVGSHVMLYTVKSLNYLLEKNGLSIEGRWFLGQDVFNLVIHMALQDPSFLESKLCSFFLDNNNELQEVIDRKELSDEVIVVARKPGAAADGRAQPRP